MSAVDRAPVGSATGRAIRASGRRVVVLFVVSSFLFASFSGASAQVPTSDAMVQQNTQKALTAVTGIMTQFNAGLKALQTTQKATGTSGSGNGLTGMLTGGGLGGLLTGLQSLTGILKSLTSVATQGMSVANIVAGLAASSQPSCTTPPPIQVVDVTCSVASGVMDVIPATDGSGTSTIDTIYDAAIAGGSFTPVAGQMNPDGSMPTYPGQTFTIESSSCPVNTAFVSAGQASVPQPQTCTPSSGSTSSPSIQSLLGLPAPGQAPTLQQGLQMLNSVLGGGQTGSAAISTLQQALYAPSGSSSASNDAVNAIRAINVTTQALSALNAAMVAKGSLASSGASNLQTLLTSIMGTSNVRSDMASNTAAVIKAVEQMTTLSGLMAANTALNSAVAIAKSPISAPGGSP